MASQYGQQSTGDLNNCRGIKIHTKLPGSEPDEPGPQVLTRWSKSAQDRPLKRTPYESDVVSRNVFLCADVIFITSCGTATFTKTGRNATIESLRNFELAFIDEFAVPGKKFNAAAFNATVNEGNAKFQQPSPMRNSARRPVLGNLKGQFDADAAHLRSKASRRKITPALGTEMKNDINKTYDHALGR